MTSTTHTVITTQVHRIYIKAGAQAIWDAITKPEWTNRYGYTGFADYDLRPGGAYQVRANDEFKAAAAAGGRPCPDVVVDGEVIEADAPRRLVTTWRMLMDPDLAAEGFSRISYDIKELDGGFCSLTVTHELEGQPKLAALVSGSLEEFGAGGGHPWILSDLKSLLETGKTLAA
ncbi:MAG TPA: SRPBCC domain-containing protein [Kineosporiaceae bacterium]|jgi:uncharacterized protein YndB with AHSA1/START domain|nr:SRPBCC domain-containing protein [Kineosporiaceae bacterium]